MKETDYTTHHDLDDIDFQGLEASVLCKWNIQLWVFQAQTITRNLI